jgi:phage terminase large subunit-like protein
MKSRLKDVSATVGLTSSTDITAFVLVFPPLDEDDKYSVMPFFWMSEDNICLRVRRDHVNYDLWEKQGFLKTTEGNAVHYGFIEELGKNITSERSPLTAGAQYRWCRTLRSEACVRILDEAIAGLLSELFMLARQ